MIKLKLLRESFVLTEKEIQRSIRRYLDVMKIFNWPSHAGQIIPAATGVPDILGVLPGSGRILAIEVKLPSWKPPSMNSKQFKHYAQQRDFIENINQSNGVAFFASSIEDVESQLMIKRKED
jgi:hypothetical protein